MQYLIRLFLQTKLEMSENAQDQRIFFVEFPLQESKLILIFVGFLGGFFARDISLYLTI